MKLSEAMRIIESGPSGYMVTFERVDGPVLVSDHFPDVRAGEPPIPTEDEAWNLAERFAASTRGKCVYVYVIRREDFTPVSDYKSRMIVNR